MRSRENSAWPLIVGGALLFVFGACTATQPPASVVATLEPIPGFWKGFWHGFIAPISFVVSLISDEVRVYAFPNSGRWYEFGFMLGISGFSGGVFAGSRSKPAKRDR
jgi:hypothetical protein